MNDKEDFKGELRYIESQRIIKNEINDPLDTFFLVLAVVFNDLKGTVLFEKLIEDTYRTAPQEEVSSHAGEYAGVITQTTKIRVASIQEFFKLLEENRNVLFSQGFQEILNKTNRDIKNRWNDILGIVFNKTPENSEFVNYLLHIRNNVAFHYNQSGKELKKAFHNFFTKRGKIPRNNLAYYSVGETMEVTRFYYADAAVGEYLRSTTYDEANFFTLKYAKELAKITADMNFAISRLLKVYLKNRPPLN